MGSTHTHARHVQPAYAGEVTPREAWERLSRDADAVLIDVRTPPEWAFAGEPDLRSVGKKLHKISWKIFPTYAVNERFVETLQESGITPEATLLFLCRTGGRSLDAAIAATSAGYSRCYNITDGFEGAPNEQQQRGLLNGWKAIRPAVEAVIEFLIFTRRVKK